MNRNGHGLVLFTGVSGRAGCVAAHGFALPSPVRGRHGHRGPETAEGHRRHFLLPLVESAGASAHTAHLLLPRCAGYRRSPPRTRHGIRRAFLPLALAARKNRSLPESMGDCNPVPRLFDGTREITALSGSIGRSPHLSLLSPHGAGNSPPANRMRSSFPRSLRDARSA